jgi:hypothetical protein
MGAAALRTVSSLHVDTFSRLPYAVGIPTKKAAIKKVPVTRRSLIARINRKLAHGSEKLCKSSPRCESTLGEYFIVSTDPHDGRAVLRMGVEVESYARKLGVLDVWEELGE